MVMRILLAAGDSDDSHALGEQLREAMNCEVYFAHGSDAGIAVFNSLWASLDLVVTQMHFEGEAPYSGLRLIERVDRFREHYVPVIAITAYGSTEQATRAMERGAFCYVFKDAQGHIPFELLRATITRSQMRLELSGQLERKTIELETANRELESLADKLEKLATTDELTGLANLRLFMERFEEEIARGHRDPKPFSVLLFDLDHFKTINDTLGHQQGDLVLKDIGEVLRQSTRLSDTRGRLGGDEFGVLLPNTSLKDLHDVAKKLLQVLKKYEFERLPGLKEPLQVSFSVGGCTVPPELQWTSDQIRRRADNLLYKAKSLGRNRFCIAGIPPFEVVLSNLSLLARQHRPGFDKRSCLICHASDQAEQEAWIGELTEILREAHLQVSRINWCGLEPGQLPDLRLQLENSDAVLLACSDNMAGLLSREVTGARLCASRLEANDLLRSRFKRDKAAPHAVLPVVPPDTRLMNMPAWLEDRPVIDLRNTCEREANMLDLLLQIHRLPFNHPEVAELRKMLKQEAHLNEPRELTIVGGKGGA